MEKLLIDSKNNIANEYFIKGSSYFTVEMPEYFNFNKMLLEIKKKLPVEFNSIYNEKIKPECLDDVSCLLFYEKNSLLQWRKLVLINPILYVGFVNLITDKKIGKN